MTTQVKKWVCFMIGTGSCINFEIACAALIVFAAWTLNEAPGKISLCGAHEVMDLATLESSSECSR